MRRSKIISAVRKFFTRRGASVEVQKIAGTDGSGYTHLITGIKNPDKVAHLLPFLFPENELRGRNVFAVEIPDDFRFCTECGCSDNNACLGGCRWVDEMLCSSCVYEEAAK
jgi:hypothetical protein